MRSELIQIVACDNYDGFQLQIFTKIHYFKDYLITKPTIG
jgi:hypothetical protein